MESAWFSLHQSSNPEGAMKIRELMTTQVVRVRSDATLKEVAATLLEHGISGVPVIDESERVVGVVSEADFLAKEQGEPDASSGFRTLISIGGPEPDERLQARTAGEAMSSPALTVRPDEEVSEAARRMGEAKVNRLPVCEGGKLVGIVTRADFVRAFMRSDDEIAREITDDLIVNTLWVRRPEKLSIHVQDGVVTLDGPLDSEVDVELLPKLVSRVPGVVSVEANLVWEGDVDLTKTQSGDRKDT